MTYTLKKTLSIVISLLLIISTFAMADFSAFDQNDGPERLAYSHAAEAVHIEPKHFFESLNCHCVCIFNQK